ncbi:GNAT family N-acetyltransferase [Patescibacteria group bacterium]
MSKKDLETAISWAASEGWNPGLYDLEAFYCADPEGFFVGYLDDEPISSISAVSYGGQFGFIGLYIVKPEYRGKGYGIQIWYEAVKYLTNHNIGLDGVVAQQEDYKKSGFKLAYRNIRYEGKGKKITAKFPGLKLLKDIPFKKVLEYDQKIFPMPRSEFLNPWFTQPESLSLGVVRNKKLVGFGMVRKCQEGYKVGPLFADNEKIADALLRNFLNFIGPDEKIYLDVPDINKNAVKLAKQYSMKPMFETARMYTEKSPKVDLHKVFGVTSFELG